MPKGELPSSPLLSLNPWDPIPTVGDSTTTLESLLSGLEALEDPSFELKQKVVERIINTLLISMSFIAATPYFISALSAPDSLADEYQQLDFLAEDGWNQTAAIPILLGSGVGNALLTLQTLLYCYKNSGLFIEEIRKELNNYLKKNASSEDNEEQSLTGEHSFKAKTRNEWAKYILGKAIQLPLAYITGSFSAQVYANVLDGKKQIPDWALNPMYWLILFPSIAEPYMSLDSVPRIKANIAGSIKNGIERLSGKNQDITHAERSEYLVNKLGAVLSKLTHQKKNGINSSAINTLLDKIYRSNEIFYVLENPIAFYALLENIIDLDEHLDVYADGFKGFAEQLKMTYAKSTLLTGLAKTASIGSFTFMQLMYLESTYMDEDSDYPKTNIFIANAVLWFLGVWTLLNLCSVQPNPIDGGKKGYWEEMLGKAGFWTCAFFGGALAYMLTADNYEAQKTNDAFLPDLFEIVPQTLAMPWAWVTASIYNAMFAEGALEHVGRLIDDIRGSKYNPTADGYTALQQSQIARLMKVYKVLIAYQSDDRLKDIMQKNTIGSSINGGSSSLNAKVDAKLTTLRNNQIKTGASPWAKAQALMDDCVINPIAACCSKLTASMRNQ
jgi:hypothetical protein